MDAQMEEFSKRWTDLREAHNRQAAIINEHRDVLNHNFEVYNGKLAKLHLCPDCGRSLHMHLLDGGSWHLECVHCGYCSVDYKAPGVERDEGGIICLKARGERVNGLAISKR